MFFYLNLIIFIQEEKATSVQAIDQKTRLLLFKMVNNEILEDVNGTISTGKEAVVLHATGGMWVL